MTIAQTAKALGTSEQFVRVGLQREKFPFGTCVKLGKSEQRYTYLIVPTKVAQYLGITMDELEERVNYAEEI